MSGKLVWGGLGQRHIATDAGRGARGRGSFPGVLGGPDDEDIAVVSNADPGQVKYGSGIITANGPRVVPGIITSHPLQKRISSSGNRINTGSPVYVERSSEALKAKSMSRQSLIDIVSSKLSIGSRKRFSRDSFSASYINRAHVASELDITRKTREARRKEIRNQFTKVDKWETSTSGSERRGCRWTFVFDPAGRLCYYWSVVVSLAFLYNFWVMIYRFAFQEINANTIIIWFSLDYFADFIYILDILFHFRTGYLEDGVLQTDSRKLRQHYMNSTTFYIDCLCLLPLDFLYLSIGFRSVLRCFRLVKIYKFWHFLDRTERHTNSPNFFRTVMLIHYVTVIFHWNACIFQLIVENHGFSRSIELWLNETLKVNSSEKARVDDDSGDIVLKYLKSFYWCTLALTTIGDLPRPITKGDYAFQMLQLLFGLFMFATILGHIANIVTNVSAARKEFQAKLDGVKTYMRMRRVPGTLQAKVIKWFDYLWLTQKSSDEEKSVSCLPDKLKAEIAIHVHLDTLKRVEIFQNTEAGFLCELVLRLRPVLFSPGDYICRKGEVGKEMYIVNRGRLQVVTDNGKTMLASLKAGSYFGEISILNMGTAGNRRTASVRSVGYSDLFVLSKKDMWDVLKEYPAARVRLEAIACKRLEKYKKAPLEKDVSAPAPFEPPIPPSLPPVPKLRLPDPHSARQSLTPDTHLAAAMGRSMSTPGLVESSGRVPLEDMWLPPALKPPLVPMQRSSYSPTTSPSPSRSHAHRSQTLDSERHTMESVLSDSSSRHSPSTDEDKHTHVSRYQGTAAPCARSGTTASVTSYESGDKRSTITSPSNVISPVMSPSYTTAHVAYTLPVPPQAMDMSVSPISEQLISASSLPAPAELIHASHSAGTIPRDSPQELLLAEIRRLRERLVTVESENASMTFKLNQQQWDVQNRLREIEMQLCGNSSNGSSNDDSERNRESII